MLTAANAEAPSESTRSASLDPHGLAVYEGEDVGALRDDAPAVLEAAHLLVPVGPAAR